MSSMPVSCRARENQGALLDWWRYLGAFRRVVRGKGVTRPHSIEYIKQLLAWGFDKEFIARDAGITVDSLEMRLYRQKKREQANGHQRSESETGDDQPHS